MRVGDSVVIGAPPQDVWDYIAEPENYLRFMSGVTRWEVDGDVRSGRGARYRMLIRVGAAEIGGLIEIVEFRSPNDMAWNSITGIDQRGRWRLRQTGKNRTRVEFRLAYGVAGGGITGWISEVVAAPTMGRHVRRSLQQLKRQVEHERLRAEAERRRGARERVSAV